MALVMKPILGETSTRSHRNQRKRHRASDNHRKHREGPHRRAARTGRRLAPRSPNRDRAERRLATDIDSRPGRAEPAALDRRPLGAVLVAELGEAVVAAIGADGSVIADPFVPPRVSRTLRLPRGPSARAQGSRQPRSRDRARARRCRPTSRPPAGRRGWAQPAGRPPSGSGAEAVLPRGGGGGRRASLLAALPARPGISGFVPLGTGGGVGGG